MPEFPVVHGVTVAVASPDDYDVDFEHPKRRHEIESYVVSGLGMAIAALFFLQFMYVKLGLLRKTDGETACLMLAWLSSIAVQAVALRSYYLGLMGVHAWELSLDDYIFGSKFMVISPILYAICTGASKMSLILFYRKLSPQRWWKWSVYFVLFLVAGYNISIFFAIIFGCQPFNKHWDVRVTEGSCVNRPAIYICTAVLGIASDLLLLVMPMPMIMRLQMPPRQKAGLVLLFGIGSATLVTSVVRLILLMPILTTTDTTWVISSAVVWIYVEANLLVICASLTTLRRFFIHAAPKLIGERGSSAGYAVSGSKGTRGHPFRTIGSVANKGKVDKYGMDIEEAGFDLKTIGQAEPTETEVKAYETGAQPQKMIKHLRRQESINKFGDAASETRLWDPRKDSDEGDRAIVQTTTVTVVYEERGKRGL
ncbi:hypothetical protein NCS57_01108600 [Fusarium keratoplasticum]|uniref:Uncharacterized protein n=1 Tax=Fusarium keratoplasticum TaxID=1328300 RepID=A0ACC0QKQ5_9HYPO|nr:hypothetical protein NCS57_01108600 [Fusarium keratoplasticum]KAI8657306.1 hypothetical protein NCS57_01108600 [Fusarium keratoplasticum]